ncbi:MAG TPA: HD domain-containing protein [Steroidobacteraceae bacterium]|nr:HD domain-containing protein [Steroidobacteraceae bacterium]
MSPADEVFALFDERGAGAYYGERVSMTEHMLQAAHFAQAEAAPPALVIAALLHDVGHLIETVPDELADWTTDARHEEVGSRWLAQRFPASVSEPVRLHVPAKRYLCATESAYFAKLSPASVVTLRLQGGPMMRDETARFEAEPFYREAVRVRRWDDAGKVAGLATPRLEHYRALINSVSAQLRHEKV